MKIKIMKIFFTLNRNGLIQQFYRKYYMTYHLLKPGKKSWLGIAFKENLRGTGSL